MSKLGFAVSVVSPWKEIEPSSEAEPVRFVALSKGAKGPAVVTIAVSKATEADASYELVEKKIERLTQQFKNYELIEKAGITVDGVLAFKITFLRDMANARQKCQSFIFVKGNDAYQIDTVARNDEYQLYSADIDKLVASFKTLPNGKRF